MPKLTPWERMAIAAGEVFDDATANCAHAAGEALADFPRAQRALAIGLQIGRVSTEIDAARAAAAIAGCEPAGATGAAWGVAHVPTGAAICVRRNGPAWWRRGTRGLVRVPARNVVASWSA